jgi:hypothetical protein
VLDVDSGLSGQAGKSGSAVAGGVRVDRGRTRIRNLREIIDRDRTVGIPDAPH